MDKLNDKKLGLYLSFKRNEIELYEKIKTTNNYSQLIKKLLKSYFDNKCEDNINSEYENTLKLTVEDLCKIISSVNMSNTNPIIAKLDVEKSDEKSNNNKNYIPEDMLAGL